MNATTEKRRRGLPLPASVTSQQCRALEAALLRLDAVEAVDPYEDGLRISYRFPALSFADIWYRANDIIELRLSWLQRLRLTLSAALEDNERDYALHPCGWHRHLAELHARHADSTGAGHRTLWQRYSGRRGGTTA